MTIQTFPSTPTPDVNIKRAVKPRVEVAQFGDGYSQRVSLGINQKPIEIMLSFSTINDVEKATLELFFEQHSRGQVFYWKMPDETTPRKWYIPAAGWDVTYIRFGLYNVSVNMVECFDIV
jgi:phage-related protein